MVKEFNYQAETFEICVDGKTYPVSTSKLFLIQRMQELCDETSKSESPDIVGFIEKIYEYLKKFLAKMCLIPSLKIRNMMSCLCPNFVAICQKWQNRK